jgi:hypothetical protein
MWKVGEYNCCQGDPKCANNKTKKLVDNIFASYELEKDTARDDLFSVIADREMDAEYYKYKYDDTWNELQLALLDLENAKKSIPSNTQSS